jgi:hypothetical protein
VASKFFLQGLGSSLLSFSLALFSAPKILNFGPAATCKGYIATFLSINFELHGKGAQESDV